MTAYEQWVQLEYNRLDLAILMRDATDRQWAETMKPVAKEWAKESKDLLKVIRKPIRRKRMSRTWSLF